MSNFVIGVTTLSVLPMMFIIPLLLVGPVTKYDTSIKTSIVVLLSWIGSLSVVFALSAGIEYAVSATKNSLKTTIAQEVIATLQYQTKGN